MEISNQNETFGSFLKAQREKKGIRLEEIASITKIHLRSLELLEAGQWKQLPPDPFLRGFILAYSKYVGIDPKESIERFLMEAHPEQPIPGTATNSAPGPQSTSPERIPAPLGNAAEIMNQRQTLPYQKIGLAAGAILVLGLFIFITRVGQRASEPQTAVVPSNPATVASSETAAVVAPKTDVDTAKAIANEAKPETRESASTTPATTASTTPQAPSEFAHELVIEGKERTWLKVVIDKEPATELFLPEGEKVTYKAKEKIKIVLGNSTGTKVSHNGEIVAGTKLQGTIRQYLFPADARFPQDAASRRSAASKVTDSEPPAASSETDANQ